MLCLINHDFFPVNKFNYPRFREQFSQKWFLIVGKFNRITAARRITRCLMTNGKRRSGLMENWSWCCSIWKKRLDYPAFGWMVTRCFVSITHSFIHQATRNAAVSFTHVLARTVYKQFNPLAYRLDVNCRRRLCRVDGDKMRITCSVFHDTFVERETRKHNCFQHIKHPPKAHLHELNISLEEEKKKPARSKRESRSRTRSFN
jgi:hypothetical protein